MRLREFAIIILNAICALSEPSCYLAAACTPLIEYLITFLEAADINMHQVILIYPGISSLAWFIVIVHSLFNNMV